MFALEMKSFAAQLIEWGRQHGRSDLPWQQPSSPYRTWVSEIMLQQTQVATVIPYFERFMQRFPSVQALAAADLDEVLHHWAGLGYYARGRNLHRAAAIIQEQYDGRLPESFEQIEALPGIGRSTAGAILSLAMRQRYPILDGNVKRVFCRYFLIEGWPGLSKVQGRLWSLAETLLPEQEVCLYNQSLMDLGAMVCKRSKPQCGECPFEADCEARQQDAMARYPASKPQKTKPVKMVTMLMLQDAAGSVLLQQRPGSGIWGGLWSFPEFADADEAKGWLASRHSAAVDGIDAWPILRHSFTHYHLQIQPLHVVINTPKECVMDGDRWVWYNNASSEALGLPAPIKQLMNKLHLHQEVLS